MTDVFISYSRKDQDFVRRLFSTLAAHRRGVWVDWQDIPISAMFLDEIFNGIEKADNFVFVISPDSLISEYCTYELNHARQHHKRIIPIVRREIDEKGIPDIWNGKGWKSQAEENWKVLKTINWLFMREKVNSANGSSEDLDPFTEKFDELIKAVETDPDYVRAHTRLTVRAEEWKQNGRSTDFLLYGEDLHYAEGWLARSKPETSPSPTCLQLRYIAASRRHRRELIAAEKRRTAELNEAAERATRAAERARRATQRAVLAGGIAVLLTVIAVIAGIVARQSYLQNQLSSSRSLADTGVSLQRDHDYRDAARYFCAALKIIGGENAAVENVKIPQNLSGCYSGVVSVPISALELNNQIEGLADACLNVDSFACASESYQHLIEVDPQRSTAYISLALVYRQQGRYTKASQILDQIDQGPHAPATPRTKLSIQRVRISLDFYQCHWSRVTTAVTPKYISDLKSNLASQLVEEVTFYLAASYQALGDSTQANRYWGDYASIPASGVYKEDQRRAEAKTRKIECVF